jgi:hypothetical protein
MKSLFICPVAGLLSRDHPALFRHELAAIKVSWIAGYPPSESSFRCEGQPRYRTTAGNNFSRGLVYWTTFTNGTVLTQDIHLYLYQNHVPYQFSLPNESEWFLIGLRKQSLQVKLLSSTKEMYALEEPSLIH